MAQIVKPLGATKKKVIVGRGASSKGRACGRGHDGQNSRSGGGVRLGFEGGQMPLYRRIARRGFSNYPFKVERQAISLDAISRAYSDGETVSAETLRAKGLVKGQKLLFSCQEIWPAAIERVMQMTEEEYGSAAPGFELRCMQHEGLYSRLYMS